MRHHHPTALLRAAFSIARFDVHVAARAVARAVARESAGLRRLAAVSALVGGAVCAVGSAQAADPQVAISVTPIPSTVTFSRPALTPPLPTYAAYRIKVVNNSTNTLNNVRFSGTTAVVLANPEARSAPLREAIGLACATTNAARTSIECAIGQLRGGGGAGATAEFTLVFDTPTSGAAPVACSADHPPPSCDRISFSTTTYYSEGSSDNGGAAHTDTTELTAHTHLGTPTTTEVKSFVPTGGGQFFTGIDGVPRSNADPALSDLWTTTVDVPSLAAGGAQVLESNDLFISDVTIPGSFTGLIITLRRDASTIPKNAKIANSIITYQHDLSNAATKITVQSCAITGGPTPGKPCFDASNPPFEYTKRNAPIPDLIGDWEYRILAVDNGRFAG